jgi:hypothetical protein
MLLFERIFSMLSGFNCIWTALMNKRIVLARLTDLSQPEP